MAGELGAEIGDCAVRHTKMAHNPSDELDGGLSSEGSDRLDLHPLHEFVDCIQPPDREQPGARDGLERLSWLVDVLGM
jgi:hypothetical protein